MNHPGSITQRVYYWREGNDEVDFIVENNDTLFAIEVKSGLKKTGPGLPAFLKKFPKARILQIGGNNGISLEDFFALELR